MRMTVKPIHQSLWRNDRVKTKERETQKVPNVTGLLGRLSKVQKMF